VCIGSFSDARLDALRARFGDRLCTSMGPRDVAKVRIGAWVGRPRRPEGPLAAQVPLRQGPVPIVTPAFVAHCHEVGLQVHVWTIDDPAVMGELVAMGVDGIMTDRPAVLRGVLERAGRWASG
jgi:glycerophosphoryl diester phosphodiesterase